MRPTPCGCTSALLPEFTGLPLMRRHRNCASGGSSSQAPYPSPRRKRQVSSIPLLVLSKQQTLRWFAVWFRFCLARKKYAKKRRRTRNSAYAQKNRSFRCAFFRSSVRSPNALRATEESGFYSARNIVLVVPLAPVEYLTYGSRKRRRVFRLRRRAIPIRICIAFFADLKCALHKPKLRE